MPSSNVGLPQRFYVVAGIAIVANLALGIYVNVAGVDFSWWYWLPIVSVIGLVMWGAVLSWLRSSDIFDPEDPLGGAGLMDMGPGYSHVTKKRPGSSR